MSFEICSCGIWKNFSQDERSWEVLDKSVYTVGRHETADFQLQGEWHGPNSSKLCRVLLCSQAWAFFVLAFSLLSLMASILQGSIQGFS